MRGLEYTGLLFLAVAAASALFTWIVRRILIRNAILDRPNQRSSHTRPTPRGGGWGLMLVLLPVWIWGTWRAGRLGEPYEIVIVAGAVGLMAISWIDDRNGLGPLPRFAAQIVAAVLVMVSLPADLSLFDGWLPIWLDRAVAALAWLWFVNLFNFMDGIDGIAGGSAVAMGIGIWLVSMVHGPHPLDALRGAMIAAAAVGFLVWNWSPAKIFLGDVGSVPLGYLLGYELIHLAMDGGQAAALIVALYYLADATITLLKRLLRGERVWRAHREHFYQRAVQGGRSHGAVAFAATLVQLMLAAIAFAADLRFGWIMLIPAAVLVALLLGWMAQSPKQAA